MSDETIVVLKKQVDDLLEMVSEIRELLIGDGSKDKPGIVIRLDRLEQLEESRNVHRVIMYTTIAGLIADRIWHFILGR